MSSSTTTDSNIAAVADASSISAASPSAPAAVAVLAQDCNASPSTSAGKSCSGCHRSLHSSAFSATQGRNPAKTRKCMECVIKSNANVGNGTAAPSASAASNTSNASKSTPPTAASSSSSSASTTASSSSTTAPAPKKKKAKTPGDIARERAAERTAAANAANPRKQEDGMQISFKSKPKSSSSSSSSSSSTATSSKKNPNSIFSAARKSTDQSGKRSLLDDDEDWFRPEAEAALEEIFRRFDSTHKGADGKPSTSATVPRDSLAWTLADVQNFARTANGKEFSTEEINEIHENLDHDDQGRLTCQGFLDFYHLQTTSHPDETWKDLKKLGYGDLLTLQSATVAAAATSTEASPSPSADAQQ